jgi:hypothetical protein
MPRPPRNPVALQCSPMCMQCVAQSTPMVATGLVVLRRRSLKAFLEAALVSPITRLRRA